MVGKTWADLGKGGENKAKMIVFSMMWRLAIVG